MKKLLMYIVVAIVLVSAGFSIYYVVRNNEEIYIAEGCEILYINEGETLPIPISRDHPAAYTDMEVKPGYEAYVDIDLENWTITAKAAGTKSVAFTSTNKKYKGKTFEISCHIGNGSTSHPFFIRNEEDFKKIGTGDWLYSSSYQLAYDLTFSAPIDPVGVEYHNGELVINEFTGSFSGGKDRHKISNAQIIQGEKNYGSAGIFAVIGKGGKVEDLTVENASISGRFNYAGVIAGVNRGLIGKCDIRSSSVTNTYESGFTGGICGVNERYAGSDDYAQVNICSSNVAISSKWVAGGAVGYNKGGVIFNCLIKTSALSISTESEQAGEFSYFGGLAGISDAVEVVSNNATEYYDPYVSNSVAFISGINAVNSHIGGIFGAYYGARSGAYEAEGNYNMLFYIAPSDIKPFYLCGDDVVISDKNPSTAQGYAKQISNEEFLQKSTYSQIPNNRWDFASAWELEEGFFMQLGFNRLDGKSLSYQFFPTNGEVYEIATLTDLKAAFDLMRAKPSKNIVYLIKEDLTHDNKNENWLPIGTPERPFKGQVISDGGSITVKNVNISAEFAGLFGYIEGANTLIQNIKVDGAVVEGTYAGAIAAYNAGATIQNCSAFNFEIKTSKYGAAIVGFNDGSVKGAIINALQVLDDNNEPKFDPETGDPIYGYGGEGVIEIAPDHSRVVYLGGFAGKNTGNIDGAISYKLDIDIDFAGTNETLYVGGAVGQNQGIINLADVNYLRITANQFNQTAYAGGIVGHSTGKISSSTTKDANNINFNLANANVLAGGIAGFIERGSKIEYSSVITLTMSAYSVGGFVGVCNGDIDQSYISPVTSITGQYAGGFTCSLSGSVKNSMSAITLGGSTITAGMTVYLRSGSHIDYCYINPTFVTEIAGGNLFEKQDKPYAETSSQFRARPDVFGKITNTIVVGDMDNVEMLGITFFGSGIVMINNTQAKVQTSFATWATDFLYSNLQGVTGSASKLNELKFDKGIWNIEMGSGENYVLPSRAVGPQIDKNGIVKEF